MQANIQNIILVPLTDVSDESKLKILNIRNEEGVKKWMYTNHTIDLNEHLEWIDRLKDDTTQIVFVIFDDKNEALGSVSVKAVDRFHKKTDWAFYLTKNSRGGLGPAIEYAFIDFVFNRLDMLKLNCEVIEGNYAVVKFHQKFLFKEEGFSQSNIIKDDQRLGIHFLGLKKEDWILNKEKVYGKYKKVLEKFNISINWNQSLE